MSRTLVRRQAVRRALLLLAFVAFPVTMNYFSPYLIVESASNGVVNGSLIVFGSMFASSLIFGRRGGCHSVRWMAPFMIIGRAARNTLAWPGRLCDWSPNRRSAGSAGRARRRAR